jgi:diguanylate cyclase (GGDEF)-like protein
MVALTNLILLSVEAIVYFAVMAGLFRLRHRFGIGTFFCALGTMHFLETYLASIVYVQVLGGLTLSPGSIVLFSGKLVMLLLVYIREDAAAVRQPIYGLLFGNFLMVGLVVLIGYHLVVPTGERLPDLGFMGEMGGLMVWGTILLFIDSILIILIYERSRDWLGGRQTIRIILSAAIVLTFDQLGFFTALHFLLGVPIGVLYGGWIAKMGAALAFGAMTGVYLSFIEGPRLGRLSAPNLSDIFDTLTYRQRYEALLKKTGRDSLTGVLDRGSFDQEGSAALAAASTAGRPASLLVIDIDHFKSLNDRHGHATGDLALRRIAGVLQAAIRDVDRVYRYGGEEFVVLCDGLAYSPAMVLAERLRRRIAMTALDDIAAGVTGSIGVATAPDDGTDLALLFATADQRLYAAKAAGRDRVVGRPASDSVVRELRRPA